MPSSTTTTDATAIAPRSRAAASRRRAASRRASQARPSAGRRSGSAERASCRRRASGRGRPSTVGGEPASSGRPSQSVTRSVAAAAYTSERSSPAAPASCSGAENPGVAPRAATVSRSPPRPKSRTFTLPSRQRNTLPGLRVPVHHPAGVGVLERPRDLHRDRERLAPLQGSALEPGRQGLPLEQLEDQVEAAGRGAQLVERDDARVVERRQRLRLLDQLVGGRVGGAHDLERDGAPEDRVARLVHHREPAAAELAEDLEAPQPLPGAQDALRLRARTFEARWSDGVERGEQR